MIRLVITGKSPGLLSEKLSDPRAGDGPPPEESTVRSLILSFLPFLILPTPTAGQRPAGAPRTARPVDGWRVTTARSEMTDQPSITLQLDALNSVPGPVVDVRPALYVRCHEQKLDVFITTGTVLDGNTRDRTSVRIRWGSGTPQEGSWSRSTDN